VADVEKPLSEIVEPQSATELGHVHLLGIGGVGVSAVARLFLAEGHTVSGTDAKDVPVLKELAAAGASVHVGFDASHVDGADTVVLSSVIKDGNVELERARSLGLRILHRSQALAALMVGRLGITVAGTHGKTTTSSMIAVMLSAAGQDPTFAIGAAIPELGTNAALGTGSAFVAEADESDGSFLNYRPRIAVITNVEADHLDHYGTVTPTCCHRAACWSRARTTRVRRPPPPACAAPGPTSGCSPTASHRTLTCAWQPRTTPASPPPQSSATTRANTGSGSRCPGTTTCSTLRRPTSWGATSASMPTPR
jgi:hypothetical protein